MFSLLIKKRINISNLDKKSVKKVSDFLNNFGHTESIVELSDTARSAEEAASALRVEVGAIVKSLFFLIHDDTQEIPVITLISGDKRCNTDTIIKVLDIQGVVKRPDAKIVKEITGYSIGGVSPVALPPDIRMIIDSSLRRFGRIWSAAGHTHCVFSATFSELKKMTGSIESDLIT